MFEVSTSKKQRHAERSEASSDSMHRVQGYFGLRLSMTIVMLCVMLCSDKSFALQQIDTSYTVFSTHKKLLKQYPDVKPVLPESSNMIREIRDVVYLGASSAEMIRALHADIFIPNKPDQKFPAVIMVHGGGWRSGNKSMNTPMAQRLAENGFVVISIEYRLSPEATYPAAVHDVKYAVRWVRKNADRYQVRKDYIALAGASAGGQLVTLAGSTNGEKAFEGKLGLSETSSDVQAVIDMDGLLDFTDPESLILQRTETSADVSWLGGFYEAVPDRWREASAISWVSRNDPPMLFINSSQTRFHAGCNRMVEKRNALGLYSEVQTLKDAPHSYWLFEPWFEPAVKYTTEFLNRIFDN